MVTLYFAYQHVLTLDEKLKKMEKERSEIQSKENIEKETKLKSDLNENSKKIENEVQKNEDLQGNISKMMENIETLQATQRSIQDNYEKEKKLREATEIELKRTAAENQK